MCSQHRWSGVSTASGRTTVRYRTRSGAVAGQAYWPRGRVGAFRWSLGDPVARVAHELSDGAKRCDQCPAEPAGPGRHRLGARLPGALEIDLVAIGPDRRHGLPVGLRKLEIETVRH